MKKTSLMIAALIALTGVVQAATIEQTGTITAHNPNSSGTLTFNHFNTSLGTLTGVLVESYLKSWGGSYAVDNEAETVSTGTATMSTLLSFDYQGKYVDNINLVNTTTANFTLQPNDSDSSSTVDYTGLDFDEMQGTQLTSTKQGGVALLSQFQGTGTFGFLYDTIQSQNWTGLGGVSTASTPTTAEGWVKITYTYDVVPEPTSMALLAIGCAVLGLRRRSGNLQKV